MKRYNIGDVVTVQIGNRYDSSGYREHVKHTVVAVNNSFGFINYLCLEVGTDSSYARCIESVHATAGELYSTSGVDSSCAKALALLGFKLPEPVAA